MAFNQVSWQPDDEVTSDKLQQMADNEQYCYDNQIAGYLTWRRNTSNANMNGRAEGTEKYQKVYPIQVFFDSGAPAQTYNITVPYPNVFTKPPLLSVTVADGGGKHMLPLILEDHRTDRCIVQLYARDLSSITFVGNIHVVAFGV